MSTAPATLFAPPPASVVSAAGTWVDQLLVGNAVVTLCVLAVAFLGVLLMSGRLAVREALRVTVGCFVVLGAPVIAAGLLDAAGYGAVPGVTLPGAAYQTPGAPALPPANYDPYAGASLRTD